MFNKSESEPREHQMNRTGSTGPFKSQMAKFHCCLSKAGKETLWWHNHMTWLCTAAFSSKNSRKAQQFLCGSATSLQCLLRSFCRESKRVKSVMYAGGRGEGSERGKWVHFTELHKPQGHLLAQNKWMHVQTSKLLLNAKNTIFREEVFIKGQLQRKFQRLENPISV